MVWTRLIDGISSRLAFFPPSPSYTIEAHGDGARELYLQPIERGLKPVPRAQVVRLTIPNSRSEETIVTAFVPAHSKVRFTLLHSHGNAVDLGQMLPLYEELARVLKVNVLAYDYRGYGLSSGQPAASQTLQDISIVLGFVLEKYQLEDVVLYGQSVGTGPTSWLAAKTPGLAGVVLHSPFMSGLRVMRPTLQRWPTWADIFPNLKYVPKIKAKTLIMHGTEDEVIGVEQGQKLHELCQNPSDPLFAEGSNHQDVEAHPEYIPTLRRFLKECYGEEYSRQFTGRI